jgi:signal peptidase I
MNKSDHPLDAAKVAHDTILPDTPPGDAPAGGAARSSGSGAGRPAKKESWFEVGKTIVYALLIAAVIRSFLFQPFNIPSGSMEATLLVGDYLFVSKSSYGFSRYSFPFAIFPFSGRFFTGTPERGDIVVFKYPVDNSTDYIKRLIGLPGDRIQMKEGVLYINEQPVPKTRVEDYVETVGGQPHHVPQYKETLPNGVSYFVLDREPEGNLDDTQIFVVPEGHYFMMGDNRDNSADSRVDVGYVPFENFVGKAQIIFFSTDGSARLWEFWRWPFAIRYGRIGELTR